MNIATRLRLLQCVVSRIRSIRSDRKWWAYFLIYILWTRMKRNQLLLIRSCWWLFKASGCTEPVDHHERNVEDELARVLRVFYREAITELEKEVIVKPFTPSACKRQLIHYQNYPPLMRHRYFRATVAAFAQQSYNIRATSVHPCKRCYKSAGRCIDD